MLILTPGWGFDALCRASRSVTDNPENMAEVLAANLAWFAVWLALRQPFSASARFFGIVAALLLAVLDIGVLFGGYVC